MNFFWFPIPIVQFVADLFQIYSKIFFAVPSMAGRLTPKWSYRRVSNFARQAWGTPLLWVESCGKKRFTSEFCFLGLKRMREN